MLNTLFWVLFSISISAKCKYMRNVSLALIRSFQVMLNVSDGYVGVMPVLITLDGGRVVIIERPGDILFEVYNGVVLGKVSGLHSRSYESGLYLSFISNQS